MQAWLLAQFKKEIKVNAALVSQVYFIALTDATVYVGGLDDKVTEPTLWELFLQAGPVGK